MNITELISKHTGEDGKLNTEAFIKELKEEQGKEFVPKADFNTKNEELKTANKTLADLKKDNKDNEELQTKVDDYEKDIKELQGELAGVQKTTAIKEALTSAGAHDVDYMMFKLGEVEVNKDGSIKDLDNKIKALKEANPTFFEEKKDPEDSKTDPPSGFKVIDNGLDGDGKPSKSYSFEELSKLTTEEINQNWDAVSASLEKGE